MVILFPHFSSGGIETKKPEWWIVLNLKNFLNISKFKTSVIYVRKISSINLFFLLILTVLFFFISPTPLAVDFILKDKSPIIRESILFFSSLLKSRSQEKVFSQVITFCRILNQFNLKWKHFSFQFPIVGITLNKSLTLKITKRRRRCSSSSLVSSFFILFSPAFDIVNIFKMFERLCCLSVLFDKEQINSFIILIFIFLP